MPNKFPNKPPLRRHKEIHKLLTSQRCWVAATMNRRLGPICGAEARERALAQVSQPTDLHGYNAAVVQHRW